MRKIDFLAGVPLCLFTTLLLKIAHFFQAARKIVPKNILLIELSEMGSTILVDPAMQKLKNNLNANLFFVIFMLRFYYRFLTFLLFLKKTRPAYNY